MTEQRNYVLEIAEATAAGDVARLSAIAIALFAENARMASLAAAAESLRASAADRQQRRRDRVRGSRDVTERHAASRDASVPSVTVPAEPPSPTPPPTSPFFPHTPNKTPPSSPPPPTPTPAPRARGPADPLRRVPRFEELTVVLTLDAVAQVEGWCRAGRNASSIVATIMAAHERDGFAWSVIDRAVIELGASRDGTFSSKGLRAFCQDLVKPPEDNPAPRAAGNRQAQMDEGERFLAITKGL